MRHKIVISDRLFNVVDEVQDIASNIRWEYNRIGGCGAFSFDIEEKWGSRSIFGTNFNVKIYRRNPSDNDYDLWYQGRIEDKINNIRGDQEVLTVRGNGYQSALKDIYIDTDYSSSTVTTIVDSIITTVAANTDVIKGTITDGSFTADTFNVNQTAKSAVESLAELQGSIEWGVDATRTFYFNAKSSTVGFEIPFGQEPLNFSNDSTSKDMVNRVIVVGGDVSGTTFTRVVEDTNAQVKFGRRDKVLNNANITTNDVADQFGNSVITELKDIVRRASVTLLSEDQVEATLPIPLMQFRPRGIRYGEKNYYTFLYSGLINYQVQRVQYSLDNEGNLTKRIQLGQLRPSIAESINQLEFKLEQQAATNV